MSQTVLSKSLCSCGCGRLKRVGGTLSSTCYMRKYRATAKGKAAQSKANKNWRKKDHARAHYHDTVYKKAWRERTAFYVPQSLHELRKAVKNLEQALAKTEGH